MQRMADAEAQYRELCAAAGVPVDEVKAECTCEWCRNNQKTLKHNMMAKVTS